MKKLVFNISINAPKQKVWDTMLQPETYKEWVAASWPGSFYKGKWARGEKISFISDDGSGTLALIQELKPGEFISAVHIAILLAGGIEDTASELAKNWVGITEQYTFKANNGTTELAIEINTKPDWEKMFNDGWPNALKKLKEICER
jgi:uncharacterized protein YndB with AHSA1/START domain